MIIRFADHETRLGTDAERAAFLERIPRALGRTDWVLHAYALMGTHVHLVMTAGNCPIEAFLKSLLVSVARYLNRAQRRFGPVVAERATTVLMPRSRMAWLVAYVHNNPRRAGLVEDAADSDWTSHRAWTGRALRPEWLAVDEGLSAAGFEDDPGGWAAFDEFVRQRAGDPRDPRLSGTLSQRARAEVRQDLALPVEIGVPDLREAPDRHELRHAGPLWVAPRWGGSLDLLVASAARLMDCPLEEVRSRARRRAAVQARRVVMVAGVWLLRRRVNELAAALTISSGSASRLLGQGRRALTDARTVAADLRTAAGT